MFDSLSIRMASNIGPSLTTNSITRFISRTSWGSVGITTRTKINMRSVYIFQRCKYLCIQIFYLRHICHHLFPLVAEHSKEVLMVWEDWETISISLARGLAAVGQHLEQPCPNRVWDHGPSNSSLATLSCTFQHPLSNVNFWHMNLLYTFDYWTLQKHSFVVSDARLQSADTLFLLKPVDRILQTYLEGHPLWDVDEWMQWTHLMNLGHPVNQF